MSLQIDKFTEDLVTFETAKLAKEKGFNILCEFFYDSEGNSYRSDIYLNDRERNNAYSAKNLEFCKHPSQSFLQKWLREDFQLHITIFSKSQELWMYRITKPGESLENSSYYGEDYYTYEETLEDALIVSLNSI